MNCQPEIQVGRLYPDYDQYVILKCIEHGRICQRTVDETDPMKTAVMVIDEWGRHVLVNQKIQRMKERHRFLISDPDTWGEGDRWVNQETKVEYQWDGKFWHAVTEPGIVVQSDDMLYLPVHLR